MSNYYSKDDNALLEINLKALSKNYNNLKNRLDKKVKCAATVKANAYGIGDKPVIKNLIKDGCKIFFVAHFSEAVRLRNYSKSIKIFCYHGINLKNFREFMKFNIIPVTNTLDQVLMIDSLNKQKKFNKKIAVHFDTGMSRLGLDKKETKWLLENKSKISNIKIELIMSHLACADQPKNPMNEKQLKKFNLIRKEFKKSKASLANSAGMFLNKKYHFDLVRPGIALYGGNPFINKDIKLHNVIKLKAKIIQIRQIQKNDTVGYGATFKAKKDMLIGTIAIGYADGINRKFSNNMYVSLNNINLKVLGRISMDLITIDMSRFPELLNSKKIVYVDVINKLNNINNISKNINTISYEILTSLGNRYKRKYI
ncbi:alanine racemase [Pelagibacterales bacterium]|nr:alanine racemase [Pelagibacterales bacterium]